MIEYTELMESLQRWVLLSNSSYFLASLKINEAQVLFRHMGQFAIQETNMKYM